MNDPVHVHDEAELTTAPLDTDEVFLERPGTPVTTFGQKVSNFFKWLTLAKDSIGNIKFLPGSGLAMASNLYQGGIDSAVCGRKNLADSGGWVNVGGVSRAIVTCTRVTNNSLIFLSFNGPIVDNASGAGSITVQSRAPGNAFTVQSSDPAEERPFVWFIIEPYTS